MRKEVINVLTRNDKDPRVKPWRNLKINGKKCIKLLSMSLAFVFVSSAVSAIMKGCSDDEVVFPAKTSINSLTNDISDQTTLDENFSTFTLEGKNLNTLLAEYEKTRQSISIDECYDKLYYIGKIILANYMAESLGIDVSDVTGLTVAATEDGDCSATIKYKEANTYKVIGDIDIEEEKNQSYTAKMTGEGYNMVNNILKCSKKQLRTAEDVDSIYYSYLDFMLTKGKMDGDEISFNVDKDKVKSYKRANKY